MISTNYIPNSIRQKKTLSCDLCHSSTHKNQKSRLYYSSSFDFHNHLREAHCTKEGGSFVCLYGPNNVCPSLPIDGVSEVDYKKHVSKVHSGGQSSFENSATTTMNTGNYIYYLNILKKFYWKNRLKCIFKKINYRFFNLIQHFY